MAGTNSSIGTAWLQIKPTLKGVSSDIQKQLEGEGKSGASSFNKSFSNSFLASAKTTFASAFTEFGARSEAAFAQFKTAALVGFGAAFAGGVALMKNFIDSASELQGLRASFESLTGSAKGAVEVMGALATFGKSTAFSNEQINQTARLFLGAGIEAKDLLKIMGQVGDLAGATGADLQSLALPISQAMAAGKLQTQDWYQILNQGGGVFKKYIIAALGAGHSTKTFADDLSEGAINASVLQKALGLATQEGGAAFQGAIKQANTFNGRMSNLKESITNVGLSIIGVDSQTGEVDPSGIFSKLSNAVAEATVWLTENKDEIIKWVNDVITAGKEVAKWVSDNKELVLTILSIVVGFKALQIVTGGVIGVMKTLSPYVNLVKGTIQGVAGLTQKLFGLGGSSKVAAEIAGGMDKMTEANKRAPKTFTFGESVSSFFKNIGKSLSGAVDSVMSPIKSILSGAGEAIGGFFKALSNPQLLIGVLVFAASAGAIALSILMIGGAIGAVTPGLSSFMNDVIAPLGLLLLTVFVVALSAVTVALITLMTSAIIPLVGAVAGGLTRAFGAIGSVIGVAGSAISGVVFSISSGIVNVINSISNLLRSVGGQDWYGTGFGITRNFSAGLVDGLIVLLQDSLNKIVNNLINIPGIGAALKSVGVQANAINLNGFKIGRRAMGGPVFGAGSATSDSIPMALSNGEYVIKAAAAQRIGYSNLDALNSTGEVEGSGDNFEININGYNKDPQELADEISKIIALRRKRVMG
jgi:tape measure domain-containing protein